MTALRLAMLALAAVGVSAGAGELRVLRTSATDASPSEPITITFDRPVAPALEGTLDASAYFRIEPAVAGKAEWRDPVTLRFTPAQALARQTVYRVTVAPGLKGMDGSELSAPFSFEVRPPGPEVQRVWAENGWDGLGWVPSVPALRVLVQGQVDAGVAERLIRIAFQQPGCIVAHSVGVRVVAQRAPAPDTSPEARRRALLRARWQRGTVEDARVLELAPLAPLPPGCAGMLVTPSRLDDVSPGEPRQWPLSVRGPLALRVARCGVTTGCSSGPAVVEFTNPVRGSELVRHVRLEPGMKFQVDTGEASASWSLDATLKPREHYAVVVDTLLRDVFGQRLAAVAVQAFATGPVAPTVTYEYGKLLVERRGLGTLAVLHINVDTLRVQYAPVPDSLEPAFLAETWGGWRGGWDRLRPFRQELHLVVPAPPDRSMITGVRVPVRGRGATGGTLVALRVMATDSARVGAAPIALVQVTDLAVHARVGTDQGVVWVTGVGDGQARAGVAVELRGRDGQVRSRGRTGADGLALLTGFRADTAQASAEECEDCGWSGSFDGYVVATLGDDRAVAAVNGYDPDLSPWQFGVFGAWGDERWPLAGTVFTERGIYRPGEVVHAKAIVRTGPLGSLAAPGPRDSLKLVFLDRERRALQERTLAPGRFGTAAAELTVPREAPLGVYALRLQLRRDGQWRRVAETSYTVAEYRPPEFLVDASAAAGPLSAGDPLKVSLSARYLFGAPMGRAPVEWTVRRERAWIWEHDIPGLDDEWYVGGGGWWEDDGSDAGQAPSVVANGTDTLDARGQLQLSQPTPVSTSGRPMRVTLAATVSDANRQVVSASASALVHASDFYIAALPEPRAYVLQAGKPLAVQIRAVRPDGKDVSGVEVAGALVRREWHQVHVYRGDGAREYGEIVADTVARCRVQTPAPAGSCAFTPAQGGDYVVVLTAKDGRGRAVKTSFYRWFTGGGFVPWEDESKLKMQVVPDKKRYTVGDTATVLVAAPFVGAEAWVTVERERVLEQRRIRITDGSTALRFPITEKLVPNAFVSVVLVRGRSAPPRYLDDAGRPTLRVGYAELRVTPERKRLAVEVKPLKAEYRPGDTARIALHVRDAAGRGVASEVTLWAVDEGVLSLTGYQTPDPLDLIYRERGLGMRLASNLASVAPQVPEGEKGWRAPGGGGGQDVNGILRSRFRSTAFFLASVVTDARGDAVAAGELPDNLTTFRVMAVAVSAGDRYGKGEAKLLATRPLVARPALPRFLRAGDELLAGVVVNQRAGGTPRVKVSADATGVALTSGRTREATLTAGRGAEIRFGFRALAGDSATFRFDASGAGDADAVRLAIPIRPPYHPVTHTVAGLLHDSATVELPLPDELDPAASTLRVQLGSSPLAALRGYRTLLEVYPYYCSEQVSSAALPLIALYRAQKETGVTLLRGHPEVEIAEAVAILSRRQGENGAIGFWEREDWSTPWLSAYAGGVLLDARDAGVPVSDVVLTKLAGYLTQSLHRPTTVATLVSAWYERDPRLNLTDEVAAADFLSRYGRPDIATENRLLPIVSRIAWEDRLLLGEMLARRGQHALAGSIVTMTLAGVRVEGRKAVLPAEAGRLHYFPSQARPYARAIRALLAVDPNSPLLAPLAEALVDRGRLAALARWNTHDLGTAASALAAFARRQAAAGPRAVRILDGSGRPLVQVTARGVAPIDTALVLAPLVRTLPDGSRVLRLRLAAPEPGAPVHYDVNVREVPRGPAVRPRDAGIAVERWYERASDGQPIVSAREGELVRVRLRVTVPVERHFVVLDDALPAGLEPVDLSLRTMSAFAQSSALDLDETRKSWWYGSWDSGWWTPFDHKEIRDERVVYSATYLWPGSTRLTYLARATTVGKFAMPAAHAEEMYNPGVNGRSGGGVFTVEAVK